MKSGRGGAREGAGAHSKWRHGKTQTIRVPVAISDQVLEIAKKLDREETLENVTESKTLDLRPFKVYKVRNLLTVNLDDLKTLFHEVMVDPSKLPKSKG